MINLFHTHRIKKSFHDCFFKMMELQKILFQFYLEKKYQTTPALFEKTLYKQKRAFFRVLQKTRKQLKSKIEKQIFSKIEHLSDILFSLHQLRFRVRDVSLYDIAKLELHHLDLSLTHLLLHLARFSSRQTASIDLENYLNQIHAFEALNQRTLRLVVNDPMIFLFFIQDLYAVYDELQVMEILYENKNRK